MTHISCSLRLCQRKYSLDLFSGEAASPERWFLGVLIFFARFVTNGRAWVGAQRHAPGTFPLPLLSCPDPQHLQLCFSLSPSLSLSRTEISPFLLLSTQSLFLSRWVSRSAQPSCRLSPRARSSLNRHRPCLPTPSSASSSSGLLRRSRSEAKSGKLSTRTSLFVSCVREGAQG